MPYREIFLAQLNPKGNCSMERSDDLSQVVVVYAVGFLA